MQIAEPCERRSTAAKRACASIAPSPAAHESPVVTNELPDVIAQHLNVLFCGINPGLSAVATGHHFAGQSNRFWRVIHLAGFTPEEISPRDDRTLLQYRCGLTTVVDRATSRADQLAHGEFISAATRLQRKIARYAPTSVAFLGKAGYCALSNQRNVAWGLQAPRMGNATIWVLPNPSGRNRAFSVERLIDAYRALYLAACV